MQILKHETEKSLAKKRKYALICKHYQTFAMRRVFTRLVQLRNKHL
jgi:hypothetical protein